MKTTITRIKSLTSEWKYESLKNVRESTKKINLTKHVLASARGFKQQQYAKKVRAFDVSINTCYVLCEGYDTAETSRLKKYISYVKISRSSLGRVVDFCFNYC